MALPTNKSRLPHFSTNLTYGSKWLFQCKGHWTYFSLRIYVVDYFFLISRPHPIQSVNGNSVAHLLVSVLRTTIFFVQKWSLFTLWLPSSTWNKAIYLWQPSRPQNFDRCWYWSLLLIIWMLNISLQWGGHCLQYSDR